VIALETAMLEELGRVEGRAAEFTGAQVDS